VDGGGRKGCLNILIDREKGREDCIFILGHKVERRYAVTCVGTSRMIRSGISTTNLLNRASSFGQ
jgi:hypothetical protein